MSEFIFRWVFEGKIVDPFQEFFICQTSTTTITTTSSTRTFSSLIMNTNNECLWNDQYILSSDIKYGAKVGKHMKQVEPPLIPLIPPFISDVLLKMLLRIGKSINFIKAFSSCNKHIFEEKSTSSSSDEMVVCDSENVPIDGTHHSKSIQHRVEELFQSPNLLFLNERLSYRVFSQIASIVDKQLLEVIMNEHNFMDHMMMIKNFLLFREDLFFVDLIASLESELNKSNPSLILKSNLNFILESSFKSSYFQRYYNQYLPCVRINLDSCSEKSSPSPSSSSTHCWDLFSLTYVVGSPLNVIFTQKSMGIYTKVFKFLFHIKRAQSGLNQLSQMCIFVSHKKSMMNVYEVQSLIHMSQLLHREMNEFMNALQQYIALNVIENNWNNFVDAIKTATSLDDVIMKHQLFIDIIHDKLSFNEDNKEKSSDITAILNLIMRFCKEQKALYNECFEVSQNRYKQDKLYQDKKKNKNSSSTTTTTTTTTMMTTPDVSMEADTSFDEGVHNSERDVVFRNLLNNELITKFNRTFKEFKFLIKKLELTKIDVDNLASSSSSLSSTTSSTLSLSQVKTVADFALLVNFSNFYTPKQSSKPTTTTSTSTK
eukprot:TRINITY_DN4407_c0_g2_i1.p1 TRINITY_DN4407_c0_g2~~TRINITY_DN4407_c0_g2_i1.p1  ORF type:complete len:664 (-),score=156.37 TRINITY_DN4407_c0_g2_i1:26-1822(-)